MTPTPAIRLYLREIAAYPLLTADDEIVLAQRIECGCEEARLLLINSNLRLVVHIAQESRFLIPTIDTMDLVSEGNIGLMKAAERYDWRRGSRFASVARLWIEGEIKRAITQQGAFIRLPSAVAKRARLMTAEDRFEMSAGYHEVVSLTMEIRQAGSVHAFSSATCEFEIPDLYATEIPDAVDMSHRVLLLKSALGRLSRRERIAVLKRYDIPVEQYADA